MPRKKTAKRTTKRRMTKNTLAIMQKLEKDFLQAPAKLADQLNKEILSLKQKENKLKNVINKIKAQIKNSETRVQTATKFKNTSAGRKQLNIAKKAYSETVKTQTALSKQSQEITKLLDVITKKQTKLAALRKHLSQFEKEWAANSKKIKNKVTANPKTIAPPMLEQPNVIASATTTTDNARLNEITEITS